MTSEALEIDWRSQASCIGEIELMREPDRRAEALELCLGCPVIGPCRDFAVTDPQLRRIHRDFKVWFQVIGGLHPAELRRWVRSGARKSEIHIIECLHCGRRLGSRDLRQKMCSESCRKARYRAQRRDWGRERNRRRQLKVSA